MQQCIIYFIYLFIFNLSKIYTVVQVSNERIAPPSIKWKHLTKKDTTDLRTKYLNTRHNTLHVIHNNRFVWLRKRDAPMNLASEIDKHVVQSFLWFCKKNTSELLVLPRQPNTNIYGNVFFSWLTQARYAMIVFFSFLWDLKPIYLPTSYTHQEKRQRETTGIEKKINWNTLHRSGPCLW